MDEEKLITGYHGTTNEAAMEILDNQDIKDSIKADEWLGKVKYFYDRYTNAIEYIIRKYNENKDICKAISYKNLVNNYSILMADLKCRKEDILDLDEIITLSDFVWAWEKIYEIVKDNQEFKMLTFRDGYMIDYMINEVMNYKIVIKTFDRLIKNKENRKIGNMVFDKTRIVYEIKQKYICVKDENCIKNIERFEDDFRKEYDSISGLNKIVNRRLNYEIWR